MSVSSMPWIFAFAVGILSLVLRVQHGFAPLDVHLPPSPTANATAEGLFSDTYYDARGKFRMLAKQIQGLELHTLPLPNYEHLDLTIDIAVLPGSAKHAMVHISGTHGVEGFAGSAIQSAILERKLRYGHDEKNAPTLIMVHALNPYGFARLRRFNENNVDINRNFLTPEEFAHLQKQDTNKYHYDEIDFALNPDEDIEKITYSFWLQAIRMLTKFSYEAIKTGVVAGNYHYPKTVYYGGDRMELSLKLLRQFLLDHIDFKSLKKFSCMDIHTGLGPSGYDTMLLETSSNLELIKSTLPKEHEVGKLIFMGDDKAAVSQGYNAVKGLVNAGIASMLPKQLLPKAILVTQEFGTVPGVFILKATVEENAMYHHKPARRQPYAEKLRDAFYISKSPSWKANVIDRGISVFDQIYEYTSPREN